MGHSFLRLRSGAETRGEIHGACKHDIIDRIVEECCGVRISLSMRFLKAATVGTPLDVEIWDGSHYSDKWVSRRHALIEGPESMVRTRWNAALERSLDIKSQQSDYRVLTQNCNTVIADLCNAMGLSRPKPKTVLVGSKHALKDLKTLTNSFNDCASPADIESLRRETVRLLRLADVHYSEEAATKITSERPNGPHWLQAEGL